MRVKSLEIRWHETTPIFGADFHQVDPSEYRQIAHPYQLQADPGTSSAQPAAQEDERLWRLATAGADKLVRLWLVRPRPSACGTTGTTTTTASTHGKLADPRVEYLATLKQHTGVVNVVRWSPKGDCLASAGDDGNILFWVPGESSAVFGESAEDRAYEREHWRVKTMLRSKSGQEIYDLTWSPDAQFILAGSVDHTATIYDVASGNAIHVIAEHTNYVQGVAWDPKNHFIATQSSDRSMHIYALHQGSNGEIRTTAVGKNSRMEVHSTWTSGSASKTDSRSAQPAKPASSSKGKETERPDVQQRAPSRASDSSESSSARMSHLDTPATTAIDDAETHSMEPPARPSASRRSSTATSISASSPALGPSGYRHLRSPSPAPLPAVKLAPAAASPKGRSSSKSDSQRLYTDATSTPFFRRLAWSTDGSLLLTPAGLWEDPYAAVTATGGLEQPAKETRKDEKKGPKPTVYIYSRANVSRPPIAHLPGHQTTSIAIRFNPVLWELRHLDDEESECTDVKISTETQEIALASASSSSAAQKGKASASKKSLFELPYRMIYAVATLDVIYLYDTQQAGAIAMFGNLHYASFTDLTWSPDGLTLIVSSQDGYCSVIAFEPDELGKPYIAPISHSVPGPTTSTAASTTATVEQPQPYRPAPTIAQLLSSPAVQKTTHTAAAAAQASAPPSSPLVVSAATAEKRGSEAAEVGAGDDEPSKKKGKRATLTHHGP